MSSERATSRLGTAAVAAAALSFAVAGGCADFRRGEYWDEAETGDTGTGGGAGASYAVDVHPLMVTGCERCHSPGESAAHTDFLVLADDEESTYQSTLSFVDLEAPDQSRLLAKMAGSGHSGGTIYDEHSAEYDLVLAWIEGGAQP